MNLKLEVEVENGSTTPEQNSENVEQGSDPEPDLEKQLADAQNEIAELRDKMLRGAAENENFKKRVERERQASLKYAGETIFREILPVVDNLSGPSRRGC